MLFMYRSGYSIISRLDTLNQLYNLVFADIATRDMRDAEELIIPIGDGIDTIRDKYERIVDHKEHEADEIDALYNELEKSINKEMRRILIVIKKMDLTDSSQIKEFYMTRRGAMGDRSYDR